MAPIQLVEVKDRQLTVSRITVDAGDSEYCKQELFRKPFCTQGLASDLGWFVL